MILTLTKTKLEQDENYLKDTLTILNDLFIEINRIYSQTKYNNNTEFTWKDTEIITAEGYAFECGIVYGSGFTIEKRDLYGDNPLYYYSDENGSIFLQEIFLLNSTVALPNEEPISAYKFKDNENVILYIETITSTLRNINLDHMVKKKIF